MADIQKLITLTQKNDAGPYFDVFYSADCVNFTQSVDGDNVYLPSVSSTVVVTVPDTTNCIKLQSIPAPCDNFVISGSVPTTTTTSTTLAPTTTTTSTTTVEPTTTTTSTTTAAPTTTTTTSTTATGDVYYYLVSCDAGDPTDYRTGQTYEEIDPNIIYAFNTLVEDTIGNYYRIGGVTDANDTSVGLVTVYPGTTDCPTTTTTSTTTVAPTTTTTTSTTIASCNCITVDVLNTQLTDGGLDLYYILNDCDGGSRDVNLAETIGSEVGGSTYFGLCSRGTTSDLFKYGPSGDPFVGLPGMNINPNGTVCTVDGDCLPVTPTTTTTTSTTIEPTTTTTTSTTSGTTTSTTTSTTVPTTTTTTSTTAPLGCFTYSVQNDSFSQDASIDYTDCDGNPVNDVIIPADSGTPDFCAEEGSITVNYGNVVITVEATTCTVVPTTTTTTSTTAATTTSTTTSTTEAPTTTTTTSTTLAYNYYRLDECDGGPDELILRTTATYSTNTSFEFFGGCFRIYQNTTVTDWNNNPSLQIQGEGTVYANCTECEGGTTTTSTTTSTTAAPSCNCITVDVLNTQLQSGGEDLYYIINDCGGGARDVNLQTTIGIEDGGSTYFGLCSDATLSNLFKYGPSGDPFVGLPGMNINPNATVCTVDGDCFPVVP